LARIEPKGDVLVAYSARAGTLAQDGAGKHSPYAEALLQHMATPGLDVRLMFGKVRDAVLAATRHGQEPYIYGSLTGDVVALIPGLPLTKEQDIELEFWKSVKDSTSPAVLRTYLGRYENGEFAPIARALIEYYERQLQAEVAAREQTKRRVEEERRAAEVKRIDEERKTREAALAEERKHAEVAKNAAEAILVEQKQRSEWLARTEELKMAQQEAQLAREAAAVAEKQRLEAVKAAQEAIKLAEKVIAEKRDDTEKTGYPAKVAALPTIEKTTVSHPPFPRLDADGEWLATKTYAGSHCMHKTARIALRIEKASVFKGRTKVGHVSPDGMIIFSRPSRGRPDRPVRFTAKLSSSPTLHGTYQTIGGKCVGRFALRRLSEQ
jgi:hypothetical protein